MIQGELNLYRNTYNAGARNAALNLAGKIKDEIKSKYEDTDGIKQRYVLQIIDRHLKETLDEISGSTKA